MEAQKRYTAGSLFSGIGGIDLAFSLAGFDILFQVEIDEFCQKVLAKHSREYWPNAEIFADVRAVGSAELPSIDVLFGGFPCQDISNAGKREGLVDGKRSSLWFEFARIISELRPRVVLLENVEAITTPRKKENGEIAPPDMALVIDSLASMGYSARWGVIAASDVGAPHQRNRWFCVAYTERRGLLSTAAASTSAYLETRPPQTQQFSGRAFSREIESSCDLLHQETGLAYTYRQRLHEKRGYRAKTRQRIISTGSLVNTNSQHEQKQCFSEPMGAQFSSARCSGANIKGECTAPESAMGRDANGLSSKLDGAGLMAHQWPAKPNEPQHEYEPSRLTDNRVDRRNRIKALGNAVVPQVVYPIAIEIMKLLERE